MGQLYTACAGGVAAGICLVMMSKVNFTSVHKEIKHANALTQLKVLIIIVSMIKCDDGGHGNASWATEPWITQPVC